MWSHPNIHHTIPPYRLPLKYLIIEKLMKLDFGVSSLRLLMSGFFLDMVDSADVYFPSYFINQNCSFLIKIPVKITRGENKSIFH